MRKLRIFIEPRPQLHQFSLLRCSEARDNDRARFGIPPGRINPQAGSQPVDLATTSGETQIYLHFAVSICPVRYVPPDCCHYFSFLQSSSYHRTRRSTTLPLLIPKSDASLDISLLVSCDIYIVTATLSARGLPAPLRLPPHVILLSFITAPP